jgi:3-oxoacyl-[acyl-carrier protein] reductase
MDLGLGQRVALVAGGGRGIGAAAARWLAREGARVAIVSRTQAQIQLVVDEVQAEGGEALGVPCDLRDVVALEACLAQVEAELGAPTVVVDCLSAHFTPAKLHAMTDDDDVNLIEHDLLTTTRLLRRLLPAMMHRRHGRIVLVGSLAAQVGVGGGPLYAAGKTALEGLARGLAVDYSRYGITANVVRPGFVDTERFVQRVGDDPAWRTRLKKQTAIRRITSADELGALIAFVCSAHAGAITGSVLDMTGGSHLNTMW